MPHRDSKPIVPRANCVKDQRLLQPIEGAELSQIRMLKVVNTKGSAMANKDEQSKIWSVYMRKERKVKKLTYFQLFADLNIFTSFSFSINKK